MCGGIYDLREVRFSIWSIQKDVLELEVSVDDRFPSWLCLVYCNTTVLKEEATIDEIAEERPCDVSRTNQLRSRYLGWGDIRYEHKAASGIGVVAW